MNRLSYYEVSIPYHQTTAMDLDTIMNRVEYYNDSQHLLFFEGCKEHTLKFLFTCKQSESDDDVINEIRDVFDDDMTIHECKASELSELQLRKLKTMRGLCGTYSQTRGEDYTRWSISSRNELLCCLDELIGFDAFKTFFKQLDLYLQNTKAKGVGGNYNIALINNCGIIEDQFVYMLYDLYAAHGVIIDNTIIEGDLSDAMCTKRNTACLYWINSDDWEIHSGTDKLQLTSSESALQRLAKRNTVYIASMTKEQYRTASTISSFSTLFAHHVELNELSEAQKLLLTQKEVECYGFAFDKSVFLDSPILNLPLEEIKARISAAVTKKLYGMDAERTLTKEDLDTRLPICNTTGMDELASLIGLDVVKQCVKQITTFLQRRGKEAVPCLHMVFRGNPGTGKTTVARLIGRIFGELGIVERGDVFIETDREGLVGQYVGHTAIKTSGKIEQAMGGVLFIDEAYSLAGDDSFGSEAIAALVKRMEDKRKDFVCIMAGYTDEMNRLLNVNPGLRDRVQFYIDFPDYSADELIEIFCRYCTTDKYVLSENAKSILKEKILKILTHKEKNFSNARLMRKLFERTKLKQALRTTDSIIDAEDIIDVFADHDMHMLWQPCERQKIGF